MAKKQQELGGGPRQYEWPTMSDGPHHSFGCGGPNNVEHHLFVFWTDLFTFAEHWTDWGVWYLQENYKLCECERERLLNILFDNSFS